MKKCPKCKRYNPDSTDNCLFCRIALPEEKKTKTDATKSEDKGANK